MPQPRAPDSLAVSRAIREGGPGHLTFADALRLAGNERDVPRAQL